MADKLKFFSKSFEKRAKDIDVNNLMEVDNFALMCYHREDFEYLLSIPWIQNNTAVLMNLMANPAFPEDLNENVLSNITKPEVKTIIEKLIQVKAKKEERKLKQLEKERLLAEGKDDLMHFDGEQ